MQTIHEHRHTRCYGSPRMTHELHHLGFSCSINRVARLMQHADLRAQPRKAYRPKTTQPDHASHPSPNLLVSSQKPTAPGQQLVSDITYIPTQEGWLYLSIVMDLFSRCIIGWSLDESLHSNGVKKALQKALQKVIATQTRDHETIFHSDRGCQYSARSTRQLLQEQGIKQSMSGKGNCYDNAFAESVFASLKNEVLPPEQKFANHLQASVEIFDYLETFYNRRRLHSSLNYRSPQTFLKEYHQTQTLIIAHP